MGVNFVVEAAKEHLSEADAGFFDNEPANGDGARQWSGAAITGSGESSDRALWNRKDGTQ
jgi:hypothetical protein